MTEKEKMLSGMLYNPGDKELANDRRRARTLCHRYNNEEPYSENRANIMKEIIPSSPEGFTIKGDFYCDYGYNISIGNNVYINYNAIILDCAKVVIGDNVLIGPNLNIYTAGHPSNIETRKSGHEFAKPITIEEDVWIGGNVTILPGVKIGKGSIIGAGSVVNKDIPEKVTAAGNPCRIIKHLK
ncbi:sugar O-acetyltransferase [Streptobacillus canis]|uniref:sugar O-acetyltransferase n=1 Tax=Streptobacillus canis TaxID=2678686 RepID=UPI0012E12EBE|nr:sugar O-acetyltransferase [Streptobacillus canis]